MTHPQPSPKRRATKAPPTFTIQQIVSVSPLLQNALPWIMLGMHDFGFDAALAEEGEPKMDSHTHFPVGAYATLYFRRVNYWIDIMVACDIRSANALFNKVTSSTAINDYSTAKDLLTELLNFCRASLRRGFQELQEETYTPQLPLAIPSGNLSTLRRYSTPKLEFPIIVDGHFLQLTLCVTPLSPRNVSLGLLRAGDLTLDAIPLAPDSELQLINKGVLLTRELIAKLRSRFLNETSMRAISIVKPPLYHSLLHSTE